MEKEISSGAMLGIVLIALAAIIGLGFGVFAIAKNTANDGVAQVQDGLNSAGQSVYTDYDQRIVTGTQVTSAYQNFEGKNTAILIATNAYKDKCNASDAATALGLIDTGNGVKAAYKGWGLEKGDADPDGAGVIPIVVACKNHEEYADASSGLFPSGAVEGKVGTYGMLKSNGQTVPYPSFINYNALITGASGVSTDSFTSADVNACAGIYFDTNCFKTDLGFATVDGRVQFNNITGNMTKVGMMEYVSSTARYQSYLLKDGSGTIMGMVFEQQVSSN